MIELTETAIDALNRFIEGSEKAIAGLRISVEGGGCSGFQYGMRLEEALADGDQIFDVGGIKVLVDPTSEPLLNGVRIDFTEGLQGSGFQFENPNASQSCSCGKSFSC